jgi:hypothetical protein
MQTLRGSLLALVAFFAVVALAPAQSLLFVPGAGHQATAGGSIWKTDLTMFNPGSSPESVAIAFLPKSAEPADVAEVTLTIPAGISVFEDVVGQTLLSSGVGAIRLRPSGVLEATSETYLQPPLTQAGVVPPRSQNVVVPALAAASGLSQGRIFVANRFGRSETGPTYRLARSNVGFVNPQAQPVRVAIYIVGSFPGDPTVVHNVDLPGYGFAQIDDVFDTFGLSGIQVDAGAVEFSAATVPACECPSVDCCPLGPPAPVLGYATALNMTTCGTTFQAAVGE